MTKLALSLVAGLWMTAAPAAQEVLHITFDGPPIQPPGTEYRVEEYVESGVLFTPIPRPLPAPYGFARRGPSVAAGSSESGVPEYGSAYLRAAFGDSLRFSFINGSLFDLVSVRLAEYSTLAPDAVTVHFVGYRRDGSTVATDFTTDGVIDWIGPLDDFQTFSFDGMGFTNLARVEIPTSGWSLDDLMLSVADAGLPVVGWGTSTVGLPPILSGGEAISAGGFLGGLGPFDRYAMAIRPDGTVVAWGDNLAGEADVPPGLREMVAVAAGEKHGVALRMDGTVASWGARWLPPGVTNPPPDLSHVVGIAAGGDSSLALRSDGTVVQWPTNEVPAGLGNVVAVAEGNDHSLALKADGTVVAWGNNSYGQTDVPEALSDVVGIAAGRRYSLALRADGSVMGWGDNSQGQIEVPPDLTDVVAIDAGWDTSLALRSDGTVAAWGSNRYGQTELPAELSNVVAISMGAAQGWALVGDGPPSPTASVSSPNWSDGEFSVTVQGQSGRVYRLEYRDSLSSGDWKPLPLAAGRAGTLMLKDDSAKGSQRFYRVRRW